MCPCMCMYKCMYLITSVFYLYITVSSLIIGVYTLDVSYLTIIE